MGKRGSPVRYCGCLSCRGNNRKVSYRDRSVKHSWSTVKCPHCAYWFGTKTGLKIHTSMKHKEDK